MSFAVQLLWRAERDVDQILAWLQQRSPQGAAAWHLAWKDTLRTLQESADTFGHAAENEDQELEVRQITFSHAQWKGLPRTLHHPRQRRIRDARSRARTRHYIAG
jgi:plasmid stabilization system protein ParE